MEKASVRNFLSAIVCKKCSKYLYPPVRICLACSWPLCPACVSDSCPNCHKKKHLMRCIGTDRLLDDLDLPCPLAACTFTAKAARLRPHLERCLADLRLCPLRLGERCAWAGASLARVLRHCHKRHPERIVRGAEARLRFAGFRAHPDAIKCDFLTMLDAFGELFRCHYTVDYTSGRVVFVVCHGADRNGGDYMFSVAFGWAAKKHQLSYSAKCERLDERNVDNFIVADCEKLMRFCTGNDLYFTVKIWNVLQ